MPFPASNGSSFPLTLSDAWLAARNSAATIKQQATSVSSQIAAGSVSAQTIINLCSLFSNINVQLTQCAAVPGLVAYAQQQVNNPTLDVAAAFTAMQNALVACGSWIITNFPKDAGNNLLAVQFGVQGQLQWNLFTQAQLAPLATLLTTLSATIS